MKHDIVIAGVGGQGILTIAAVVGHAAVARGLHVKQSEVHGMAQRGGAVSAHLRLSSAPIHADLIAPGTADVLLAVEVLEALRHLPALAAGGVLLVNTVPVANIADYPDPDAIVRELEAVPKRVLLDADAAARTAGSARAMNMVMLGALSPFLELPEADLKATVRQAFAAKGDKVVSVNLAAFDAGRQAALEATAD